MIDVPVALESLDFTSELAQKRDEIYVSLKQRYGSFLSDSDRGTALALHTDDDVMNYRAVEMTLEHISDIEVLDIAITGESIVVIYSYKGKRDKAKINF